MWLEIGLLHIFKEGGNVYGTHIQAEAHKDTPGTRSSTV